jgi:hypothetical protein
LPVVAKTIGNHFRRRLLILRVANHTLRDTSSTIARGLSDAIVNIGMNNYRAANSVATGGKQSESA